MKPGTHLGPYEIISPLGAGGMGEVYRARDTKLGREVPPETPHCQRSNQEGFRPVTMVILKQKGHKSMISPKGKPHQACNEDRQGN